MSEENKIFLGFVVAVCITILLIVGGFVWGDQKERDDRHWRYEICLSSDRSVQECQDKLFND